MALIVVMALAGVGGSGPVARASVSGGGVLSVDYARFARAGAVHLLVIRVAPSRISAESIDVLIDRRYLRTVRVHHLSPPPEGVVVLADAVRYRFAAANAGLDTDIVLHVEPLNAGWHAAHIRLPETAAGNAAVDFRQFVWL